MSDERFPTQSISLFHVYVKPILSFDYFVLFLLLCRGIYGCVYKRCWNLLLLLFVSLVKRKSQKKKKNIFRMGVFYFFSVRPLGPLMFVDKPNIWRKKRERKRETKERKLRNRRRRNGTQGFTSNCRIADVIDCVVYSMKPNVTKGIVFIIILIFFYVAYPQGQP